MTNSKMVKAMKTRDSIAVVKDGAYLIYASLTLALLILDWRIKSKKR